MSVDPDSEDLLPAVELETAPDPTHAVVWLHGLGADGHDFEPIVPHLGLRGLAVRFVFPHAPSMPVTINGGFVMPAWYDILSEDLERRHDEAGVRASAARIEALLAREAARGIPASRVLLAGFSQGGAMALHVGLRYPERLAGILALSTYLLLEDRLETERSQANLGTPILQIHGSHDPVVHVARGRQARDRLRAAGHALSYEEYPMQHEVCMEEIVRVGAWLRERVAPEPGAGEERRR